MLDTTDALYRLLVQSVTDYAIYMLDRDGIILNWNTGAERAKGYLAEEIVGRNYECFYSPADRAAGRPGQNLALALRDGRVRDEGWRLRKDGTAFWANVTIETVRDADGTLVGFAKVTRDLTEQHEMMSRIEHAATHDPLTGVLNRAGLLHRFDVALGAGLPVSMHFIDLDRFKPVNDRLGHPAGDAVLKEVAHRLIGIVEEKGHVGRLGGDEFAVVMREGGKRTSGALRFSEDIVASLNHPIDLEVDSVSVGASVGLACSPRDGSDAVTLMRNADIALYRAKQAGRNRAVSYDVTLDPLRDSPRVVKRRAVRGGSREPRLSPIRTVGQAPDPLGNPDRSLGNVAKTFSD